MKLYIEQLPGSGVGGQSFCIYNEAGEKLPCVTRASIHHTYADATRVDVSLVVDGRNIILGSPPKAPPRPDPSEPFKKA